MFDVFYIGKKPNLFAHEQECNSVEHAQELSRTRFCWIVNYLTDYTDFDFLWEPVPWESNQIHIWPSQHQENGGTMLVPKISATDYNRKHTVLPRNHSAPIVGIDHGDGLTVTCDYQTRYISDYLGTLKRVLSKVKEEYVWVVSSVCLYDTFDFTWHPSEWQLDMLHAFPSNEQKFGDTFYVHVPSFLQKSADIKLLEWFDTIHFVEDRTVPRKSLPEIKHDLDSQADAIKQYEWNGPLALFISDGSVVDTNTVPTVPLWREKTKTIVPLSRGAGITIVPKVAVPYIKTQVYDYPNIDRTQRHMYNDQPLDIVFISNGEPNANHNWLHLELFTSKHQRVVRVDGVNGRVAAYHAAAQASTTPWFFAVFAKLQVSTDFPWLWQPDRLQEPKHYIFHAYNPVNGLQYGHQAMIAYNKNLVLSNHGNGLDFTLDNAHEVVPILSGTAHYCNSPWMAWRTAFRECIKLVGSPDIESQYRLRQWLEENNSDDYVKWSHIGARDAVEYYNLVNGDFDELKKSYEWAWLASYAFIKHNLIPDQ